MIKKYICAAAVLCSAMLMTLSASAEEAQYTDIAAYINNYPIKAYAVSGKMAIVAEDLRDYGFDVEWNDASRSLEISRNNAAALERRNVYKSVEPTGTKFSDIYESDIKVYYNGTQIQSYALNGYTLITVNDLAALAGSEEWLADKREYKVWIEGIEPCEFVPVGDRLVNIYYSRYGAGDYSSNAYNERYADFYHDMDRNGTLEHVVIQNCQDQYGRTQSAMDIDGNVIYFTSGRFCAISAVYLMDMMPDDNAKEIAVFWVFNGETQEYVLNVFRYSYGVVRELGFFEKRNMAGVIFEKDYSVGGVYTVCPDFRLYEDGSFSIQRYSESSGYWATERFYKVDEYGTIFEEEMDTHTIVNNNLPGRDYIPTVNQWGFYYVNNTDTGHGLTLRRGDYIKPLYDDDNNHVFIQKSNGESGWYTIGNYSRRACSVFY